MTICLSVLKKASGDLARVRRFSVMVQKQLDRVQKSDDARVDALTLEELQDFNKILQITDYILCKYEHKKQVHALFGDFVSMIHHSGGPLEALTDDIDELSLRADGAVRGIKEMQAGVSENFRMDSVTDSQIKHKKSGNNLTKSAIALYTHEYQLKTTQEARQVI